MENINSTLYKIFNSENAHIKERVLGGMMNETYIVTFDSKDYVLYFPQGNANEVVNRKEEKYILDIASNLGVSSKNIYFDLSTGIKCNDFIPGISLNKIHDFDFAKIANLLKKLHSSKTLSHYYYNPFKKLDNYVKQVSSFFALPDNFLKIHNTLINNKDFLMDSDLVLCHNDFQRSNIIKNADNYYIIDFEFAANNDAIYDIAAFGNNSVEEGFTLLNYYYSEPTLEQKKRYYLWRMFISLQWYLVAILKDNNGEGKIHNFDFLKVAESFMGNALTALNYFNNL